MTCSTRKHSQKKRQVGSESSDPISLRRLQNLSSLVYSKYGIKNGKGELISREVNLHSENLIIYRHLSPIETRNFGLDYL